MKTICLWSGPRNVSTALMYSFAQRADTRVVDEPLYGHYLRVSDAEHPGRNEVMASMNCDGDAVMAELLRRPADGPVSMQFLKQMAHHLVDIDRKFLHDTENILLIRDPGAMLQSLTIQLPHAVLADSGLAIQWQLYLELVENGQRPAIIDSRELLLDPAGILARLCQHLDIEFDTAMSSWPPGRRTEDGVWEKYWYQAVHKSTGFAPYEPKPPCPEALRNLLYECQPFYDLLFNHALRAQRR